jgi:hypothetical protein
MIFEIDCPYCRANLFIPSTEDEVGVLCVGCRASYLAMFGALVNSSWHIEQSYSSRELSKRIYDLRISSEGKVQSLRLVLPARQDVLSLIPADRLLILWAKHRLTLALVMNFTAGWKVPLISNRNRHVANLAGVAVILTVFGYLLGSNVLQRFLPAKIAPFVGMGISVPIAFVAFKRLRHPPFIEMDTKAIAQLSLEQSLFQRQRTVQTKLEALEEQKRQNFGVQVRLDTLHTRLLNISQGGDRLNTVIKAQALVQKQDLLLDQLIEGYERVAEIIEIDFSASQLVEALPEFQIFDNMAELELLERQREEIAAQIHDVKLS